MNEPDTVARARELRRQADWCVDMAAKAADQGIFRACIQAAAAYQQQARAMEANSGAGIGPRAG